MITENLSTLKINKLTQAQYDRELAAGNIDENALYLTPDEEVDLSEYATVEQLNTKAEQITSAIPEKLPNPNALTINDTVYDGSKAVELDTSHMEIRIYPKDGEDGYELEQTIDEILHAYEKGRELYCIWGEGRLPLLLAHGNGFTFYGVHKRVEYEVTISYSGGVTVSETALNKLPNPKALTINGTTYDGSEAVEINTTSEAIPGYWLEHLDSKISTIKGLQDANGKDCFSFIVIADPHYTQNLGKRSPTLAKYIMDKCHIRHVMVLGDLQNRGSWSTKAEVEAEWKNIEEMFEPLHELRQKGNHDGSWGNTLNGVTYPYNFTVEEMFNRVYAKTYQYHDVVTDSTGTAYYVDDKSRKVRYIMLNTHCNEYGLNDDGSAKYNNMKTYRFTQAQYDFLTSDALVNGLDDNWHVVVCAHVPINNVYSSAFGGDNIYGDHINMRNLLKAYRDKNTCTISWEGTAGGNTIGGYTNLFNTSGSGYEAWNGSKMYTNWIPYSQFVEANGDSALYHFKGWVGDTSPYKYHLAEDENGTNSSVLSYTTGSNSPAQQVLTVSDYDSSVKTLHPQNVPVYTHIRFEFREDIADSLIITANEKIVEAVESDSGYDAVVVSVDFSTAKGKFVGYFSGHTHNDYIYNYSDWGIPIITTRCDGVNENDSTLLAERVEGSITEQSFDVFTVTKNKIYATKIGAGSDRTINY